MNTVILRLRGHWQGRGRWRTRVVDPFTRTIDAVMMWRERARQRCALASLDDRMLRDIGLGRAEGEEEADKPPWRS